MKPKKTIQWSKQLATATTTTFLAPFFPPSGDSYDLYTQLSYGCSTLTRKKRGMHSQGSNQRRMQIHVQSSNARVLLGPDCALDCALSCQHIVDARERSPGAGNQMMIDSRDRKACSISSGYIIYSLFQLTPFRCRKWDFALYLGCSVP